MGGDRSPFRNRFARGVKQALPATPVGLLLYACWVVAAIYVACVDPFGIDQAAETGAEAIAQQLKAPGREWHPSHVAVVMSSRPDPVRPDPTALPHPLSHGVLAAIIEVARTAGAKAIFLDYAFEQKPDTEPFMPLSDTTGFQDLVAAVQAAERAGIPVYSGAVSTRPELAPLRAVMRRGGTTWTNDHPGDYSFTDIGGVPTAAAALYVGACTAAERAPPDCDPAAVALLRAGAAPPLAVRYDRAYPDEISPSVPLDEAAACRDNGWLKRLRNGFLGKPASAPCANQPIVLANDVINAGGSQAVLSILHDRIVMIGVGPRLGDDHVIPGIGALPGVLIHANALDNLFRFGATYPRWPGNIVASIGGWRPKMGWDDALKLAALVAVPPILTGVASSWTARETRSRRGRRRVVGWTLATLAAMTVLLLVFALIGLFVTYWPLSTLLMIVGLSALVAPLLTGAPFRQAMKPLSGATAAGVIGLAFALALALVAPVALSIPVTLLAALGVARAIRHRSARASHSPKSTKEQIA